MSSIFLPICTFLSSISLINGVQEDNGALVGKTLFKTLASPKGEAFDMKTLTLVGKTIKTLNSRPGALQVAVTCSYLLS